MDSKASWLSRASSSRRDRLSNTSHELPRWRSPSPMAASMIPPPIVQSSYASPPPPSTIAKSTFFEQPTVSDTREADMHADLQYILDAQAEALERGLSAGAGEGSTGSTTPTAASARSSVARAGSRTAQKKNTMSLRKARKELYSKIMELSRLKDEELEDLDAEAEQAARKLRQLESWGAKRKGLEEASLAVDKSEDTVRVQRLRREADALRESIFEVEAQLADMKGRHRKLAGQIAAAENETQARLASYTQSMSLLEADVQKFLTTGVPSSGLSPQVEASNGHVSVWQLPPKRRTLEMAKDYFTEERDAVLLRRRRTEQEKEALVQGGLMWKGVAAAVTEFEKRVRAEMPGAEMANSGQAWDDTPQSSPTDRLKELLVHMDVVIENLQTKYNEAEEKHWKLLVVAIGAELEALRQGKQILQGVLGQTAPEQNLVGTEVEDNEVPTTGPDSGDEIRGLDKSFETARRSRTSNGDTDDEPDPELLFSRNDTDTE